MGRRFGHSEGIVMSAFISYFKRPSLATGALILAASVGLSSTAFASCTSTLSGSTANVTCTAASDVVTISQFDGGGGTFYWFHFGGGFAGATDSADWDTGVAGQQNLAAGATTIHFVNLAGGTLNVGQASYRSADAIVGTVSLSNPGASSAIVNLDSTASSTGHTYNVPEASGVGTVTVGSLSYNDASSSHKTLNIITGTGADTVNVKSTFGPDTVNVEGNSGGDVVNVGNAGSVQSIGGLLNINNSGSFSVINLDDSADATARTATYTSAGITGLAPAAIGWASTDTSNISVKLGTAADTLNLQSVYNAIGSLTIDGTNGLDTINIGDASGVQNILTAVYITNAVNFNIMHFNDTPDTTGRNATYTASSLNGLSPGAITWSWANHVYLNMGTGADTLAIQSTTAPLNVDGNSGIDSVTVGNGSGLQNINGALYITNTLAFSNLTFDDSADTTARTANYSEAGISGALTTVAPVTISWDWASSVNLKMGTAADTVNVHSTSSPLNVQGTSGTDTVSIGNAGSAQAIYGPVSVHNSSSYSTIIVDDSADVNGHSGHYSATGLTGLAPAAAGVTWTQNDVAAVFVVFGSGDDTVHVSGTPSSGVSGGAYTYILMGDGANEMYINGAGLGAFTTNNFYGGNNNDYFDVSSAVMLSQNVTAVNIFGGNPTTFPGDELDYFAAASSSGTTGTLTPADPNAHAISYTSIEFFDYNDVIFRDGFQ